MSGRLNLGGIKPDPYILALIATVVLASVLPVRDQAATALGWISKGLVSLLFFLHGARLSPEAVRSGLTHWRLHLLVAAITFGAFPLIGVGLQSSLSGVLAQPLVLGLVFLCCLPSTVQSSIAFTSAARGNIPAAMASASGSNILGMLITPLLVSLIAHTARAETSSTALISIVSQLLLPFLAGQLARPFLNAWMQKLAKGLGYVDRGAILVVVYSAFSAAVVQGLWTRVPLPTLLICLLICLLLLIVILALVHHVSKRLGFEIEDRITILFCATKKSLVTGAPMAAILFAPATAAVVILPLMLYHQAQMIACAVIAQHYASRPATAA